MEQKPSIGRIVHFVLPDGQERPAIVTRVFTDQLVGLRIFMDADDGPFIEGADGPMFCHPDHDDAQYPLGLPSDPYTWHWPERV